VFERDREIGDSDLCIVSLRHTSTSAWFIDSRENRLIGDWSENFAVEEIGLGFIDARRLAWCHLAFLQASLRLVHVRARAPWLFARRFYHHSAERSTRPCEILSRGPSANVLNVRVVRVNWTERKGKQRAGASSCKITRKYRHNARSREANPPSASLTFHKNAERLCCGSRGWCNFINFCAHRRESKWKRVIVNTRLDIYLDIIPRARWLIMHTELTRYNM